jgi:hypothetical protein
VIVDPDFLSHWRTQLLADTLGADPCAPLYVLRIWAHCQLRKAWRFEMPPAAVKAVCKFAGEPERLEAALQASGYVRREGEFIVAVGWEEHNASLVAAWANGKLGGRKPKAHQQPPENPRVSDGLSDGNQGGSDKRREEEKKPSASSARPTVPCPYDAIRDLYHEKLPELPRAKLMSDVRQRALRKVWGWVLSSTKADGSRRATNADEALAWFGDYFARASANDFLMGRGTRSEAHANWRCDLDFLLTEKGMKHVIEKTELAA